MLSLDIEVEVRIVQNNVEITRGIRRMSTPVDMLELASNPTMLLRLLIRHYALAAYEHAISHAEVAYFKP